MAHPNARVRFLVSLCRAATNVGNRQWAYIAKRCTLCRAGIRRTASRSRNAGSAVPVQTSTAHCASMFVFINGLGLVKENEMPTGFNPPLLFLGLRPRRLPAPGAKLYHRVAGTELPKAIYYDAALTSECPQPLVADSEGRFLQFFLEGGAYRFVLFDANGVQLRPRRPPIWGANGGSIFPTPTKFRFPLLRRRHRHLSGSRSRAKSKVDADDPVAGYLSEKPTGFRHRAFC